MSSIDNLFELAVKNDANEIELIFSGGEPTLRLNQMEQIVNYIDKKIEGTDINLVTKLLTNGIVPKEKISEYDIGIIKGSDMILNEKQIVKLQALDIISMNECSNCFAKWHCRGGCRYANKGKWLGDINPQRCEMVRNIIADKILFIAGI